MENAIKVVVGLGNPGAEYVNTRHNLGFMVLDALAQSWNLSFETSRFHGALARKKMDAYELFLLKPTTYMNDSGLSVKSLLQWYKLPIASCVIVIDDVDLPLGKIRFRQRGSSGGHRGLESIINHLGSTEIARVRIGIGKHPVMAVPTFVLSTFLPEEQEQVQKAITEAKNTVISWLSQRKHEKLEHSN